MLPAFNITLIKKEFDPKDWRPPTTASIKLVVAAYVELV